MGRRETAVITISPVTHRNRGFMMITLQSKRNTSFGMECVQCREELIAPESSEFCSDGHASNVWCCQECDCCFRSPILIPIDTRLTRDIPQQGRIFRVLLLLAGRRLSQWICSCFPVELGSANNPGGRVFRGAEQV